MPIDKVASTRGHPVFGLSPENLKAYYGVRSRPYVVDGPGLGAMPKNPWLKYRYNPLLAAILNNRTHQYEGAPPMVAELYRPGGLLYKPPAAKDV